MAYSKKIPPIKLVLTIQEYNNLIGVLTNNINELEDLEVKELACMTKEKLLKYSIPRRKEDNNMEIDMRLYINEAADIISQLLSYLNSRVDEVDYFQVLLKVRESIEKNEND